MTCGDAGRMKPLQHSGSDHTGPLVQLARQAARWAADNADQVRGADPDMPAGVFNRAADNWRPLLLAIADAVGGEWPERARRAVQCVAAAAGDDDQSIRVTLLADIRVIFAEHTTERLPSAALVEALVAIEGRPWAEWKVGKPITANGLARLLAPLDQARHDPHQQRQPRRAIGFGIQDAFARYLPGEAHRTPHRQKCDGTSVSCPSATATPRWMLQFESCRKPVRRQALWRARRIESA